MDSYTSDGTDLRDLNYSIDINAPKESVWEALVDPGLYRQWANVFSNNAQFKGEWKEGEQIEFSDPDLGGTIALIEKLVLYDRIETKHVAMFGKDKAMESAAASEDAKKWIGTQEDFYLDEADGITRLKVEIRTHKDFEQMFNGAYPLALEKIRGLVEGARETEEPLQEGSL